jgi:predicted DCC family thiol-disulfide oxidoreductase YuxK
MENPETIYYDGHCGLCHRGVKFVLARDRAGILFRFAPLQGETFLAKVSPEERASLPDSMAVRTREGKLIIRAAAWIHILRRLGGTWRMLAFALGLCPARLLDFGYDTVARLRHRLFGERRELCPIIPAPLRARFDP